MSRSPFAPMKILSISHPIPLVLIAVGISLAVSVWACEVGYPITIVPSQEPSPTSAPVVRVEPTFTPSPEPTKTPTPQPTEAPTPEPTSTPTPTRTPEPSPTSTRLPTNTPEPTATTTATTVPTHTPTPTIVAPTPTHTQTNTPEPTETPSPTAASEPEPTPTSEPKPTPTAEPTVDSTPIADILVEDEELTVDEETLWSEYFETLDEVEVSCIRSALDEDDYHKMLARKVVFGQRVTDRHELEIWGCLNQENAVDLYLSAFYTFRPDGDPTDDELTEIDACHRSLLEYADIARYLELSVTDIDTYHWTVRRNQTLTWHSMAGCWFKEQSDFIPYSTFPVHEPRPINFVDGDRTSWGTDEIWVWGDGLDEVSEGERDCIRNRIGLEAYEALLAEAIFDGMTEPSDVAVWRCLSRESAVSFLGRTAAFHIGRRFENSHRTSVRDEIACMDRLLTRVDIPRLIAAGLPDVGVEDYRHGVAAIIGFGLCSRSLPLVVELDDHSDEIEGATEIAMGSSIEGNLNAKFDAESDQDVFQFNAVPGLVYELDLNYGNRGPIEFTSDELPYFSISVIKPGDYGFSTSRPVFWEPSTSGAHYLFVKGYGPLPYEFKISISDYVDDFGSDFAVATEIPIGGTVEGTIRQVNEHDNFRFLAEEGESYQLDVELSDDYSPDLGHDDLTVTFIDAERNPIEEISDRSVWQAPSSGEFFLQVSGHGYRSHQGSYSISVSLSSYQDDHGDDPESATEIRLSRNVAGSIGTDVDEDYFYFDAVDGKSYEMSIEPNDDGAIHFDLVDEEGDAVAREQSALIWQPIEEGRYFIRVWSDEIGEYTLSLDASDYVDDHRQNEPTAVLIGQPTEGYIINSSDLDVFSFVAVAGEAYDFDVELGTLNDVTISLYDAQGRWQGRFDEERSTWHAWESGDYSVYLYSPDGGSYTFTVSNSDYRDDHGDDEEYATVSEFGETVSGVIGFDAGYDWYSVVSGRGDPDMFSFVAERGRLYRIDVEPGSLLRSRFKLYAPTGDVLKTVDTGLLWEAESSGKHYVMVSGLGVGDYELTVDRFDYSNDHGDDFSSATPIEAGETLSGAIGLVAELDFFRFTATEGESYEIHLIAESFENPQVSLFDAEGAELGSEPNYVNPPFVLTDYLILNVEDLASKDYYIVVSSRRFYWVPRSLDDDWSPTSLDDSQHVGDYRLFITTRE